MNGNGHPRSAASSLPGTPPYSSGSAVSPRQGSGASAKAGNLLQQLPSAPVYKFSIVSTVSLLYILHEDPSYLHSSTRAVRLSCRVAQMWQVHVWPTSCTSWVYNKSCIHVAGPKASPTRCVPPDSCAGQPECHRAGWAHHCPVGQQVLPQADEPAGRQHQRQLSQQLV